MKLPPEFAGVYLFRDENRVVIYVGKAKNLKNRVRSYFSGSLAPKTAKMMDTAKFLNYIPVSSEFEALLLEAKLVRKYKPKYNFALRDDKSPLYIGITSENLPRVVLLRQRELTKLKLKHLYGPFINGNAPKRVLRLIRRIFPFSTHKPGKRPCVYSQIGLCNPCPSDVVKNPELKWDYLLNLRRVNAILSGKSKLIINQLERQMSDFAKAEKFEEASNTKKKLEALLYTTTREELDDGYMGNPNLLEDIRLQEMKSLAEIINFQFPIFNKKLPNRIECFDVAHLAGTYPTASMVTFIRGEPDKTLYRHYKVSDKKKNDDVGSLKSVLAKRKYRFEKWGEPDLIIVDGGRGQLSAALKVINEVPVIGLAKREETLIFKLEGEFKEYKLPDGPAKKLVQRIRDEAHRFARSYHHKLVSRAIWEN